MKVGPSAHAQTEHRDGIVALLDRLEREIAEDHLAAPQDDNADATIQAIVALLPNAPASEIKMYWTCRGIWSGARARLKPLATTTKPGGLRHWAML